MKVKKSKILNSKTIAAAFLTIGLCIVINLLLSLLDDSWEKLFSAVGSIGSVIIGVGMFYLGWQQHKHLEQKISDEERKMIIENYLKLRELIRLIQRDDYRATNESFEMLGKIQDEAQLFADEELINFMARIREMMLDDAAFTTSLEEGELSLKDVREFREEFSKFIFGKNFNPEEIYSKYLKLPNPKL
jgi:hypothetical protein